MPKRASAALSATTWRVGCWHPQTPSAAVEHAPDSDAIGQWGKLWRSKPPLDPAWDLPSTQRFLLINLGARQYRLEAGPPERRVAFDDIWYCGPQHTPIDTEAPHGSMSPEPAFLRALMPGVTAHALVTLAAFA
jgi:hypothetical protein